MGQRALTASLDDAGAQRATGARSFQILFDASNGSTRATLFAGFVPPGRAPWHYHLYDEIVWIPDGSGRVHVGEAVEAGGRAGAQFLVATLGRLPDQTFEAASIAAGAAQFGELCGTFGLIHRPLGRYAPATELSDGSSFL